MMALILACNLSALEWSRELTMASLEKFELTPSPLPPPQKKIKLKKKESGGENEEGKRKKELFKGSCLETYKCVYN